MTLVPPTSALVLGVLAGCAQTPVAHHAQTPAYAPADTLRVVNRVTWGATSDTVHRASAQGLNSFLDEQLQPDTSAVLPDDVQSQIAALQISQQSMTQLVKSSEQQRMAADALSDDVAKKAAQQAYQQSLNRVVAEAATRSLLRDLYSPKQLQEQMTWFWLNHFSVYQYKSNIRVLLPDYEDRLRAHALGRFRDLLTVTVHHPAMLRYLDNDQNAAGHINENYARELMELHTLGVDGGYTQHDVQELARVLTGLGVNFSDQTPTIKSSRVAQYVRDGLFEFNPNRHDYGDKVVLGHRIAGQGLAEVDQVLDMLANQPATARHVSRDLATYFLGDAPSPALLERLSRAFLASGGQIRDVLAELFRSDEFKRSLSREFKDPMHYVVSAVRLAYDGKTILNAQPMIGWLNRMGEPLYGHTTPDGYALSTVAWSGPGQITDRFEIAKALGSGSAGLFRTPGAQPVDHAAFPQMANALYYQYWQPTLGASTLAALEQARSPQEWNIFLLASPEFMNR